MAQGLAVPTQSVPAVLAWEVAGGGSGRAVSFLTPTGAQTQAVFVPLRLPAVPCVGAGWDHEREHLAARPPLPADVSHL